MRVKLEPDTAFIGKKFAYIFLGIIFGLNAITFGWFFYSLNWIKYIYRKLKIGIYKLNKFSY